MDYLNNDELQRLREKNIEPFYEVIIGLVLVFCATLAFALATAPNLPKLPPKPEARSKVHELPSVEVDGSRQPRVVHIPRDRAE
jgi:hypothetical protein